jgi:hypothetical protein
LNTLKEEPILVLQVTVAVLPQREAEVTEMLSPNTLALVTVRLLPRRVNDLADMLLPARNALETDATASISRYERQKTDKLLPSLTAALTDKQLPMTVPPLTDVVLPKFAPALTDNELPAAHEACKLTL